MKLINAFFRLIRWQNLVFIALTQALFYYCILTPSLPKVYYALPVKLTQPLFWLLAIASLLIAAGGYIINDYFDINIDQVNKPDGMIVEKIINRRWAIILHWVLTTAGVAISLYISMKTTFIIGLSNITCTFLLWWYSTTFKKKLLSGNIIIAALTAWTIFVIYFAANTVQKNTNISPELFTAMRHIYKLAALYSGFAFIISLIREVIKDIEDMEGDERYDCRTVPVVWGVPAAKLFAGVWTVVLIGLLLVIDLYVIQADYWLRGIYCFVLVILPLLFVLKKINDARLVSEFHKISSYIKLIMLSGILSMLFFSF
jgi:4-hydroxybenzoate polyprenyltransferase